MREDSARSCEVSRRRVRTPGWSRPGRHRPSSTKDDAPEVLQLLAEGVDARARDMARCELRTTYRPATLEGYAEQEAAGDRVWRFLVEDKLIWCVLDARSQRSLLEFVLGGPGAPTLTPVERTIVSESLSCLLGVSNQKMTEEHQERPPARGMWRCAIDLVGARPGRSTIQLFAAAALAPPTPPPQPLQIRAVPIDLRVELAPMTFALRSMREWCPGSVIPVGASGRSKAQLRVDRMLVAIGELGVCDGKRAVRLANSA